MNNGDPSVSVRDAWYSGEGPEDDVVVSTRVRLVRNLASFPFPHRYKADDAERVQSLVFDSFTKMEHAERYQAVSVSNLEPLGQRILAERGILTPDIMTRPMAGIVVSSDGRVSCTVNTGDHVKISAFVPGFDIAGSFSLTHAVDTAMQQSLQFAADPTFGCLASNLNNTGTGMKISVLMHLPSISISGFLDRIFKDIMGRGCAVTGFYGAGNEPGASLGSYYLISSGSALAGSEETQISAFSAVIKNIIEFERKTRRDVAENKKTVLKDMVYRSAAAVKYSRLVGSREAVEILSRIKWGVDTGLLSGVRENELFSLLYRVQTAHLQYVSRTSSLSYEKDITADDMKIDRLRCIVLQEALKNLQLAS